MTCLLCPPEPGYTSPTNKLSEWRVLQNRVVIIFGPYEFSPYSGELRKEGMRVRLEGQPLTILEVLLDRPGELVSRDELLKKLWPGDTFVDFEHSLNAAVKRLRAALNDPADQPHYIETLARRGYRFIAPVHMADDQIGIAASAVTPALGVAHPPLAVGGRRWWLIAAVVCVVAVVAWGWREWWHRTAYTCGPRHSILGCPSFGKLKWRSIPGIFRRRHDRGAYRTACP